MKISEKTWVDVESVMAEASSGSRAKARCFVFFSAHPPAKAGGKEEHAEAC
jgi:hypothetical protein